MRKLTLLLAFFLVTTSAFAQSKEDTQAWIKSTLEPMHHEEFKVEFSSGEFKFMLQEDTRRRIYKVHIQDIDSLKFMEIDVRHWDRLALIISVNDSSSYQLEPQYLYEEDWESGNTYKEDGEFTFEFHNYTVGKGLDVELQQAFDYLIDLNGEEGSTEIDKPER